jgi:hypothetical protein
MNKGLIIGIICLAIVSIVVVAVVVIRMINKPSPTTTSAGGATSGPTTRPPLTYIRSTPETGGLYLICEFDKPLATTKVLSEATPVTFTKCSGDSNEYCLMVDNKNVKVSGPDGFYTIYIHSLSEKTYLGLVGYPSYFDLAISPIGFSRSISTSDASIWNVVTM